MEKLTRRHAFLVLGTIIAGLTNSSIVHSQEINSQLNPLKSYTLCLDDKLQSGEQKKDVKGCYDFVDSNLNELTLDLSKFSKITVTLGSYHTASIDPYEMMALLEQKG